MIQSVTPSTDKKHKWVATFTDGQKVRFGAKGYTDYLLGATDKQKMAYHARHVKDLSTNDPYRAGFLSFYVLWGPTRNMKTNIAEYNKMFFK